MRSASAERAGVTWQTQAPHVYDKSHPVSILIRLWRNKKGSFSRLLGRQPSDAERKELYRVWDAFRLKNNDALWLILIALQYYQGQYERFPTVIAQTAKKVLTDFRATAGAAAVEESAWEVAHHVLSPAEQP